jgi:outer membrane receptor protein involved in Fe transport
MNPSKISRHSSMHRMIGILAPLAGAGFAWGADTSAPQAPVPPKPAVDGGDELAIFSDLPVVVSASRQETALNRSSVPVSVLTSEDLTYGGQYQIAEALRFVPGVDARRVDRVRPAVGVRGFHGSFSDRTLTLVDGRTADSPIFGGAEWPRLPIMMDDIERIEVVRGPGGAAWGANAFNGVVNVITKDPEEMVGVHGSSQVSAFGDSNTYVRWCQAAGNISWRIGAFYQETVSSQDALNDKTIDDNDWSRKVGTDNALVVRFNERTTLRCGIGYAALDSGVFELVSYQPPGEDNLDTTRAYARLDQQASPDTSYRVGWYGNFLSSDRPSVFDEDSRENAIEGQLDYSGIAAHRLTLGGEWRMTDLSVHNSDPNQLDLTQSPYHEQRYGAFLIDNWQATSHLTLECQIRGDYYDGTGSDWAGRVAALYGIDHDQRQVVRLAAARAYRTPLPALQDPSASRPTFGNPNLLTVFLPSDDLKNEHTWSLEAGYIAELPSDVVFRIDGFYQRYEDLIGFQSQIVPGLPTQIFLKADNLDGATGHGGEVELDWSPLTSWSERRVRVQTWYAYNHLNLDVETNDFRAWTPAEHKIGSNVRIPLPERLTFSVNYAYSDGSVDPDEGSSAHVGIHHQLDITLAWTIPGKWGELMIGGLDVLHERDEALYGTGSYLPHETPGRTLFMRATLDF